MSSSPDAQRSATLCQAVAFTVTYDLFVQVIKLPILVIPFVPLVLRLTYLVLNRFTNNHALLSILMAAALSALVRKIVELLSPSSKHFEAACGKMRIRLPLAAFGISCVSLQYIVGPIERLYDIRGVLTISPMISWGSAFTAVVFFTGLTISILLRYVGPPSVMRLSSCPLAAHPFHAMLQNLAANLSASAILQWLTAPGSMSAAVESRSLGRRYQRPDLRHLIAQVLLNAITAMGMAYFSVIPLLDYLPFKAPQNNTIVLTCVVSVLSQLSQTTLNGRSHELDPISYKARQPLTIPRTVGSLVVPSLVILACGVAMEKLMETDDSEKQYAALATFLIIGSIVFLLLQGLDHFIRFMLCTYSRNLRKIIAEVTDDNSNERVMQVAVESLSHGNILLGKELLRPCTRGFADLEKEEMRRNDAAIKEMAATLMHKSMVQEVPLEEDILRYSLLSQWGRGESVHQMDANTQKEISAWNSSDRTDAVVVPLVRALSSYAGGLGEALLDCVAEQQPKHVNSWVLPPGAIVCSMYTVRAAARILVANLSPHKIPSWRSTHVGMLIPVYLSSLHRLESGMVHWARLNGGNRLQSRELFQRECPELLALYETILDSSLGLLERLQAMEGTREIQFLGVSPDCSRWIGSILAKTVSRPASPRSTTFVHAIGH